MKKAAIYLMVGIMSWVMDPAVSLANEALQVQMQDLMKEMKAMRQSYDAEIARLKQQVKDLAKEKGQDIPAVSAKKSAGPFEVEYVGRQQGPFGKGGLQIQDHAGFAEVRVGGYADIELENFQNRNSTFDQHRWVLNLDASIGERLRFVSELEVEHGGPDSAGGGETKIEQAWFDYLIHDAVNLRAGALLVPFGRYNIYHDSPMQDLTDRPLLARDVIPTTWTEAGAGIHGQFNPKIGSYEDLTIGYETYIVNGLDAELSDTGLRGARGSLSSDNNNGKGIVGRTVISPALGQELGLSGYWGDFGSEDESIKGIGVDFLTTWGPLELLGEWAYFAASEAAPLQNPGGSGDVANHFQGFYVQANYHFWFDFLDETFLGRAFDNPTFTLVNRFGWVGIDDDFDGGNSLGHDNEEWRYTLGINYRPVESWVLKLEYQNNHSKFETLERGNDEGFIASVAMGF